MTRSIAAVAALSYLIVTLQLAHSQAPILQVTPQTDISIEGASKASEFKYELRSSGGSVGFFISGIPSWLNASFTTGTATTRPLSVTFFVGDRAKSLTPGSYSGTIIFINTANGQGTQSRKATLTVAPDKR